jgi:O-antigen/teichoic acid export membrane protein
LEETRDGNVTQTFSAVGTAQFAALAVNLGIAVVISRWLAPVGRGSFVLGTMVVQVVNMLLGLGLPVASATFLLRREHATQEVFSTSLFLTLVRIPIAGLVILGIWLFWSRFHSLGWLGLIVVWGMCAAETLYVLARNLLFSEGKMRSWMLSDITANVVLLGALGLSWLLMPKGTAVWALALCLVARLLSIGLAQRGVRLSVRLKPAWTGRMTRALMGFGLRGYLNNVVWEAGPRIGAYAVGTMLPIASLGVYSIATGLSEKVQGLLFAVPTALYRFQATAANAGRRVEYLTARALRVSLFAGLGMTLLASLSAPILIPLLFGRAFAAAVGPLVVLTLSVVLGISFHIFMGYIVGHRMRPEVSAGFGALLTAISVIANVLLVPRLGMNGAAIASLTATVVVFIPYLAYFVRLTGLTPKELLLLSRSDWELIGRRVKSGVGASLLALANR